MTLPHRQVQDGADVPGPASRIESGPRALSVAEALTAVHSADYTERAAAGVVLAAVPDLARLTETLHTLLLDPEDTWVTLTTAEALVARGDTSGMRVVAGAIARADASCADWIGDVVLDPQRTDERDRRRSALEELRLDPDPDVAAGAAQLLA